MVQSFDNVLIRQFRDMLHIEAQQAVAKTMPFVEMKPMEGDDLAYDTFSTVRSQEVQGRNQRIEFTDADFDRRKLARRRFIVPVPIDASDVRGMLLDPTGPITQACMKELNRVKDRVVVEAAFADVQTGREFGTTVTFANDGGQTVDATAGFTFERLLEIKDNFTKRNVDAVRKGILFTEQESNQLFRETELTSSDFITQRPIPNGVMNSALGIDMVEFGSAPRKDDPILAVASSVRDNVVIAMNREGRSGICMGLSKDITVRIQERTDLIETTQVVVTMEIGAVRTEGSLIQKVQTTAS